MSHELTKTMSERLSGELNRLRNIDSPRFRRLWAYYRNPARPWSALGGSVTFDGTERPYRQAQEWGLPARLTGFAPGSEPFAAQESTGVSRKEIVIENDIGWRIDTGVDYLFGKPVTIRSAAPDANRRDLIDVLVRAILARAGGLLFLQQLALTGAVYGFVDVMVKLQEPTDEEQSSCGVKDLGEPPVGDAANPKAEIRMDTEGGLTPLSAPRESGAVAAAQSTAESGRQPLTDSTIQTGPGADNTPLEALVERLARRVRLEIVDPCGALPLLRPDNWRVMDAYAVCYNAPEDSAARERQSWFKRLFGSKPEIRNSNDEFNSGLSRRLDLIEPDCWKRIADGKVVESGANSLGRIPVVHIQNSAVPFEYVGASDVEPLVPLQDELNTRMSDRASRITLQSFKMYLAKGIETFNEMPVGPGRMWQTDNPDASIQEFGGDENSPSELAHIADIREALDKTSGVSPIAAGAIKNRIGRLTSAAALRLTLTSLLARTEKKRTTYGLGLERMIELSLAWLDRAGLFRTTPEERRVELHWPSSLPENEQEKLLEAEIKLRLGVPGEIVRKELGY